MHFHTCFLTLALIHIESAVSKSRRDSSDEWSYDRPEEWGGQCNAGGNRQSPIDIVQSPKMSSLVALPLTLGEAYRWNVPLLQDPGGVISFSDNHPAILTGGSLGGAYKLLSLHFHFGSEHTIDGRRFQGEAHFVHYNMKYSSAQEAISKPDGLAVLAVLLETGNSGEKNSRLLQKLVDGVEVKEGKIRDVLPENLEPWVRYEGSLTTPPCTENVIWTVLLNPMYLHSLPEPRTPTFRSIQAISNRTIFIKEKDTSAASIIFSPKNNALLIFVVMLSHALRL